jgi:hypothetical protein
MTGDDAANITVRLPDQLAESVRLLKAATGRDNVDIVTSALRTYLADQTQRDTIRAYFEVVPDAVPRAYFVTAVAVLNNDGVLDDATRHSVERTFSQINRYTPTKLRRAPPDPRRTRRRRPCRVCG